MSSNWKTVQQLTTRDIQVHPIWEFVPEIENAPESAVRPVTQLPVTDLSRRFVGTQIGLHNGASYWAILSNITLNDVRATRHFLCLRIAMNDAWFDLARYHDVDYGRRGPSALASFLKLSASEIFPLGYDITKLVLGDASVTKGSITEVPEEKLTIEQLVAMAVSRSSPPPKATSLRRTAITPPPISTTPPAKS